MQPRQPWPASQVSVAREGSKSRRALHMPLAWLQRNLTPERLSASASALVPQAAGARARLQGQSGARAGACLLRERHCA